MLTSSLSGTSVTRESRNATVSASQHVLEIERKAPTRNIFDRFKTIDKEDSDSSDDYDMQKDSTLKVRSPSGTNYRRMSVPLHDQAMLQDIHKNDDNTSPTGNARKTNLTMAKKYSKSTLPSTIHEETKEGADRGRGWSLSWDKNDQEEEYKSAASGSPRDSDGSSSLTSRQKSNTMLPSALDAEADPPSHSRNFSAYFSATAKSAAHGDATKKHEKESTGLQKEDELGTGLEGARRKRIKRRFPTNVKEGESSLHFPHTQSGRDLVYPVPDYYNKYSAPRFSIFSRAKVHSSTICPV